MTYIKLILVVLHLDNTVVVMKKLSKGKYHRVTDTTQKVVTKKLSKAKYYRVTDTTQK